MLQWGPCNLYFKPHALKQPQTHHSIPTQSPVHRFSIFDVFFFPLEEELKFHFYYTGLDPLDGTDDPKEYMCPEPQEAEEGALNLDLVSSICGFICNYQYYYILFLFTYI